MFCIAAIPQRLKAAVVLGQLAARMELVPFPNLVESEFFSRLSDFGQLFFQ